jgi:rubredoxin
MNKHICPNCDYDLPLSYEYKEWITENNERIWTPYWMCNICGFGYPVEWDDEE